MTKPLCVIAGPYGTRSGYGDMARDIVRHIIELDRYEVKLISLPWGNTPVNALDAANPKDVPVIAATIQPPYALPRQPELFIQISVPNEFQPQGKYNIGITAGIETTLCSPEWIEGCNRMDTIWTISEHSKRIFESTFVERKDNAGNTVAQLKVVKPVEVLHNCIHTDVFRKINAKDLNSDLKAELNSVKEDFNFLFVGHWLNGDVGEDRKNVGLLVKTFCETFKDKGPMNRPGLILKTSGAGFSIMERESILKKVEAIKNSVGPNCPNVYILFGELTDAQMNSLYNHPKVKAHISFTKGEGFGRPLLEATQSQKPIIASGWSGQLDFLNPEDAVLLGGELRQVEPAAVWKGVILPESMWFNVDVNFATGAMRHVYKHYDKFLERAKRLAKKNEAQFNYDVIKNRTAELLDKYVPTFALPVQMQLPQLRKIAG
jgi:hypothetical protein